jgi:hypothetical protein
MVADEEDGHPEPCPDCFDPTGTGPITPMAD